MTRSTPEQVDDALGALVCFDLYVASRAMTRRYRPVLDEHGITYPQYLVVLHLGSAGPSTIKGVAQALRLDHATLTPIIRRMEGSGLLVREHDEADRRSVRLTLTDAGRAVHAASDEVQCTIRDDLGMTPDELRDLQTTLRRVEQAMTARVRDGGGLTAG
ncbi:MarR family transcriptional regulator [Aeromicrobium sp. CFBP 8757]|uniref:MarR family winged helix-turn-helix transcriptional regulator n=1 Tax=Aeromicrobium sp. CFBP 8757 TaxID=2775288 RepID=UPI0017812D0C|nr:MarR family transcriptional regulator [Aeromicrobium sp. CFBP 8757]MBD8606961.1 MarR family transcriptional regulator [Aeromicrobium sp. CFBP 8757]